MFVIIAKIILFGSLAGIGVMVVRKIPVLRTLPIGMAILSKKKESSLAGVLKIIGEIAKILWLSLKKIIEESFSYFKNLTKERFKEKEKPNLSDDYWEKVKSGK